MAPSGWKVGQEAVADASGLASDGHHSAVVSAKSGTVRHCRGCFNQDVFCEACGGTGSIRDHVPAADALADAETLRGVLIAYELAMVHGVIPAGTFESALAVESWAALSEVRA